MQVVFFFFVGEALLKNRGEGPGRAKEEGKGHIDEVNIERDWDSVLPGAFWLVFQIIYLWELDWLLSPSAPVSH